MKKTAISFMLVLAMVLAMVLVPAPAAEAAGAKHEHTAATNHCVCGATSTDGTNWTGGAAGIGDHDCVAETGWQPLTATGDAVAAGKYYLTGNLQSTKRFLISSGEVTICLNGYDIKGNETLTTHGNRRCFTVTGGTLNICDCQGGGEISSKTIQTNAGGSAIYMTTSSTGVVNLYSGIIVGSPVNEAAGGTVRLDKGTCNLYNAVIKDGTSNSATNRWGGNVYISDGCTMNMYGGIIQDGVADTGGNVCVNGSNATFNMTGGAITGGTVARTGNGGKINIQGGYMQLAADFYVAAESAKGYITVDATNDLVIDLNGNKLAGEATVKAGDKKLSIVDTTAAKGEAGTGLVSSTVQIDGTLAQGKPLPACAGNKAGQRYVAISNEAGSVVPHRIYVGFDTIQLYKDDNGNIGMNYVTNFQMDDEVKALLTDGANGYAVGCKFGAAAPVGYSKANYKSDIATNISAILDNDDKDATDFATAINATTFVNLTIDGQAVTIESNLYEYSLKDVYVAMDKIASGNVAGKELTGSAKDIYDFIGTEYADVVAANLNG